VRLGLEFAGRHAKPDCQKQYLDSPREQKQLAHNSNFRLKVPIYSLLAMTS